MSTPDLKLSKQIILLRVRNGWIARQERPFSTSTVDDIHVKAEALWVFASTAALCRALPELIGESGWEVSQARDAKGHFVSQKVEP